MRQRFLLRCEAVGPDMLLQQSPCDNKKSSPATPAESDSLEVGRVGPTWQRNHAIVFEVGGVKQINLRIVHVGIDDAFSQLSSRIVAGVPPK